MPYANREDKVRNDRRRYRLNRSRILRVVKKYQESHRAEIRKHPSRQPRYLRRKYIEQIDRRREIARESYRRCVRRTPIDYKKRYAAAAVKFRARGAVAHALRIGKLIRKACACGNKKSQAHHEDYSKPLRVKWLCSRCHAARHRQLSAIS